MTARLASLLIAAVAVLGVLAGCSTQAPVADPAAAPTAPAPAASSPAPAAAPDGIDIPTIGAVSDLVVTGIKLTGPGAGGLEVPDVSDPGQASYYEHAPVPGDVGPAIVLGHIDGRGRPGVFKNLSELRNGDEVLIWKGTQRLRFVVYDSIQVSKDAFPWGRVAAPVGQPELRLVTCTGAFVGGERGYSDNRVVFAALA